MENPKIIRSFRILTRLLQEHYPDHPPPIVVMYLQLIHDTLPGFLRVPEFYGDAADLFFSVLTPTAGNAAVLSIAEQCANDLNEAAYLIHFNYLHSIRKAELELLKRPLVWIAQQVKTRLASDGADRLHDLKGDFKRVMEVIVKEIIHDELD